MTDAEFKALGGSRFCDGIGFPSSVEKGNVIEFSCSTLFVIRTINNVVVCYPLSPTG